MAPSRSRVLVTGGAGFIGSHLVDHLLTSGYEVGVLDDFSTGEESNLSANLTQVKLHKGAVTDREFVMKTVDGYDAVLHQAARVSVTRSIENPTETNQVNSGGTLTMLEAARDAGIGKFVYASSSSVYGESEQLPKEESMSTRPMSPYAVSKLAGENYCRVFAAVYGMKTVSLRYFNVYGPRQKPGPYSGVVPSFVRNALAGEPAVVFGDGSQTRDFTFVKDVAQANLLCLERQLKGGEVFNVGSHSRTSINQLAGLVYRLAGVESIKPVYKPSRPGDVMHSYADISKISSQLGYKPSYSIDSGLREVISWFNSPEITRYGWHG